MLQHPKWSSCVSVVHVFIFASLLLVVLLVAYLIVIHRFPMNFDNTTRDETIVKIVYDVPKDPSFQHICTHHCRLTKEQTQEFWRLLTDSERLRMVPDYVFRNGWVGLVRGQHYYGLALPTRWPSFFLWTATVHELFHLIRHVQGEARFEDEQKYPVLHPKRIYIGLREEVIVWRKTAWVDQIGTVFLLTGLGSLPIMYAILAIWLAVSQFKLL
jgi:hypothetical protein